MNDLIKDIEAVRFQELAHDELLGFIAAAQAALKGARQEVHSRIEVLQRQVKELDDERPRRRRRRQAQAATAESGEPA